MIFQTELLIRSIKRFSSKNVHFSIVVNGEHKIELEFKRFSNLVETSIDNKYIMSNADVFYCPYHWTIPAPSRWFIEPKCEQCVFIDADVVACNDLSELNDLDDDTIHGVTAYSKTMTYDDWASIGFYKADMKFYFNFGLLIVPSKHMIDIGKKMFENILMLNERFKDHQYFSGQIALACSLRDLGLNRNVLDKRFNWYDLLPFERDSNVLFLHYMANKNYVNDYGVHTLDQNEYVKMIRDVARQVLPKSDIRKTWPQYL